MKRPKLLIIGQPFNNDTGGGITLSNLLVGWPKEQLAVACSGYSLLDNIDTEICDTYYQLGQLEHSWVFPFSLFKRKYPSGLVRLAPRQKVQNLTIPKSKLRVKLIMKGLIPLLEYTGLIHAVWNMRLSPAYCRWLDSYQPDILYTQASSLADLSFCIATHNYLKKPMIFHMMDDWPSVISHKGPLKKYWYGRIDRELRRLLDQSSLLMSICDHMSAAYRGRYGKVFIPFHNPIQLDFWKAHQRKQYDIGQAPRILYAGRTGLGINASLITVAKAVERVNREGGLSAQLVLQTGECPDWIRQYDCVKHENFVPYETLPRVFAEADLLLLPYDFSPKSIKYIQYSMPTKASEFMASGTPILAFAPEETAVIQYARSEGWAKIVSENKVELLASALRDLIGHRHERQQIAEKAKRLAEERHDAAIVARDFQQRILALSPSKEKQKQKTI